jgi:hypothetical protein
VKPHNLLWLVPSPVIAITVLSLLAGCGKKVDPDFHPATTVILRDNTSEIHIDEVCHDGIVYLITARGSITHKINPRRADFGGAITCPS